MIDTGVGDALLSDEHPPRYRYWLTRTWDRDAGTMLFIGLNPSVADALVDDQTIRRCCHFARREGFGAIAMANLYALRSTKPSALNAVPDPVGPENNTHLAALIETAGAIVCCWGANTGPDPFRAAAARQMIADAGREAFALGFTATGQPRHPSRLGNDVELVPYPLDRDSRFANREAEPSNLNEPVKASRPDPNDLCVTCGHVYLAHRGGVCTAWVPSEHLAGVDRDADPIERVTQITVKTKNRGQVHDWRSSVCACMTFTPSGVRVDTPDDDESARAVREGRERRHVLSIAELV